MDIIYKNPNELKDYSNNPRINIKAIEPVKQSIKEFGFLVPIIIDKNDEIIAGHTRKQAAVELDLKEVPCTYADNLTEDQVKAFRVIDNKTSEFSIWDFEKLEQELSEIVDIDLSIFNFPDLGEDLLVSDEDFLKGTEIVKEKQEKIIICSHCGAEIKV